MLALELLSLSLLVCGLSHDVVESCLGLVIIVCLEKGLLTMSILAVLTLLFDKLFEVLF